MKKWKIGIVGLSRGKGFVNVFSSHPEVEVTALCDIDEKKLEEVGNVFKLPDSARFSKFNDFVNADTDMVMVATPIPLHTEHTVKSLEAGKHVLCEQTVAYTVEECSRVVDAVKRTGRTYMMGENYCYFHYVREWKKVVESGKLGEIVYAEGEYIHEIVSLLVNEKTGEFFWRHERPPIWYCAHTLGPILMVMNDRVVKGCGLTSGFKAFPQYKDHPGFLDFEIGLFWERVLRAADGVKEGRFPARPGDFQCRFCDFRSSCPVHAEASPRASEGLEALAAEYEAARGKAEAVKIKLVAALKAMPGGAAETGSFSLKLRKGPRWNFRDREAVKSLLRAHGCYDRACAPLLSRVADLLDDESLPEEARRALRELAEPSESFDVELKRRRE